MYLQQEPTVELFREFYYLNRQAEFTDGPSLELGGISIQRRKEATFPAVALPSHPKDWNQTWFYCQDTSPEGENPLPGYRESRLSNRHHLPGWISTEEWAKYAHLFKYQSLNGQRLDWNRPSSMLGRLENFALKPPLQLNV